MVDEAIAKLEEDARGVSSALATARGILELHRAAEELENGNTGVELDGETFDDPQEVEERAREMALEVLITEGWHAPMTDTDGPEAFRILLTTGGPAVRVVGDIGEHGGPERVQIEAQDWFQPWRPVILDSRDERDALEWFAGLFYFGEC